MQLILSSFYNTAFSQLLEDATHKIRHVVFL